MRLVSIQHFEVARQLGRHAVIVSGHSLPTEPYVDFDQAAINLWRRLKPAPLNGQCREPVVHFSMATGQVLLLNLSPDGSLGRQLLASFSSPQACHYGQHNENRRIFIATKTRTLSIFDIYAYLPHLDLHSPGVVESLLFVAHSWEEGPILLNTLDPVPHSRWRSPADKDARRKDLRPPQLGIPEREALRKAFIGGAYCINAGCAATKPFRPFCCRSGTGQPGTRPKSERLKAAPCTTGIRTLPLQRGCPVSQPPRGLDRAGVPSPAAHALRSAAGCSRSPDFSPALDALEARLGLCRDPWGLGFVRFDPQAINDYP